jgi:hypothetical protein
MTKKRTITITVKTPKPRTGPVEWGGRDKTRHDSRPRRLRTRRARNRQAIADAT